MIYLKNILLNVQTFLALFYIVVVEKFEAYVMPIFILLILND
jgi:hypothetical protein